MSTHVALAGATGNLGRPILDALLAFEHKVTVLMRIGSSSSSKLPRHANLTVKEVDFTSVDSLIPALREVEVTVSCLATSAIGSQNPLIDAAVAAGVKRFIPAEFGMDSRNALCAQLPVCMPKVTTQEYLQLKTKENPSFSWTAIANGLFLDWCIENGILMDLKEHTATLYDGGDTPFSATLLRDILTAVIGIIHRQEKTANRVVYIHSAVVTQNQLIRYAQEKDGQKWKTTMKDSEELRQECLTEWNKSNRGDVESLLLGFSIVGCVRKGYGGDYSGHIDNELLGVNELSDVDLRNVVGNLLHK